MAIFVVAELAEEHPNNCLSEIFTNPFTGKMFSAPALQVLLVPFSATPARAPGCPGAAAMAFPANAKALETPSVPGAHVAALPTRAAKIGLSARTVPAALEIAAPLIDIDRDGPGVPLADVATAPTRPAAVDAVTDPAALVMLEPVSAAL